MITFSIILHNMIIDVEHDLDVPIEVAKEVSPIDVETKMDENN